MHVNWHTQLRFWHLVLLVKKKTTCQLTLSKLKWHVLLGMWHWGDTLKKNVDVNWHSFWFLFHSKELFWGGHGQRRHETRKNILKKWDYTRSGGHGMSQQPQVQEDFIANSFLIEVVGRPVFIISQNLTPIPDIWYVVWATQFRREPKLHFLNSPTSVGHTNSNDEN